MSFIGKDEARRRRRARVAEWAESLPSGQFVDVQQMLGDIDEIDRLRAELAETRALVPPLYWQGEEMPEGVACDGEHGHTLDKPDVVNGNLSPYLVITPELYEAVVKAAGVDQRRSVRGDAPAEPPAARTPVDEILTVELPRATPVRVPTTTGGTTVIGAGRLADRPGLDARWDERTESWAPAEAPAAELPVTLSSPDDVAAVCLAHGLTVRSSGPGWTQWRDPDTKVVVHCEAWQSGVERVTVAGRDRADIYRPVARGTLVAAIEAARGGSR